MFTASKVYKLTLNITGNLTINDTATIAVKKENGVDRGGFKRDYLATGDLTQITDLNNLDDYQFWIDPSATTVDWNLRNGGIGCGSPGIYRSGETNTVKSFGDYRNPNTPGQGGSSHTYGVGGGILNFTVNGSCALNTTNVAIDASGWRGGGGGSINGECSSFTGTAGVNLIRANGSSYMDYFWVQTAGSGGGCIKLESTGNISTYTNGLDFPEDATSLASIKTAITAFGGDGKNNSGGTRVRGHGGAGTIVLKNSGSTNGVLLVVNNKSDYDPMDGKTFFPITDVNGGIVNDSDPATNTIRIPTNPLATDFEKLPNYFQGSSIKLWQTGTGEPLSTAAPTPIYNISSNDQRNFVLASVPPVITNDYNYRFLYYLDDLIIQGSANVDFQTGDIILDSCPIATAAGINVVDATSTLSRNTTETSCATIGP